MFNLFKKRKNPEKRDDAEKIEKLKKAFSDYENSFNRYMDEKNAILERLKREPENSLLLSYLQTTEMKICQTRRAMEQLDAEIRRFECNIY